MPFGMFPLQMRQPFKHRHMRQDSIQLTAAHCTLIMLKKISSKKWKKKQNYQLYMYEDKSFYTTISVAEKTAKIVQLGPSNGL